MTEDLQTLKLLVPKEYIRNQDDWEALQALSNELAKLLSGQANIYSIRGGGGQAYDIVIAFIAGGTLTAIINGIYQVIHAYLGKYQGRELTFEHGDKKITLKGRSAKEEMELLKTFFPESLNQNSSDDKVIRGYLYDPAIPLEEGPENYEDSGGQDSDQARAESR